MRLKLTQHGFSPVRARTRATRCGGDRANHEATAPLHRQCFLVLDRLVCDATLLPRRKYFVTDQKTFMLGGQILQVKSIYVNYSQPFILPFFEQVCS